MGSSPGFTKGHSQGWLSGLAQIFLTLPCPLCDRPCRATLCSPCQQQLQRCRLPADQSRLQGPLPVLAWGAYRGPLKQAIAALKYGHHQALAQPLGLSMGQIWQQQSACLQPPPVIVPIPLHRDKLRQRGFNQADLLAHWFSRVTRLPVEPQGLCRRRSTEAQYRLGSTERQRNVAGAFALGPAFQHQRPTTVLLLDDIYTTGATAQAAAAVLRQRHIKVLGICTLARAMADSSPFPPASP